MFQQGSQAVSAPRKKKSKKRQSARRPGSDGMDTAAIPVETLTHLNQNQIYLQESRSKRSFVCQVCGHHLPSLGSSLHHAEQPAHKTNLQTAHVKSLLLHLPSITQAHRLVLNQTLTDASQGVLIRDAELTRRRKFAEHLIRWLESQVPQLKLSRVGSTWTGIALIDSDVNLDLSYRDTEDCSPNVPRRICSRQTVPHTLILPSETALRNPGLGYLLINVFEVLKAHAKPDGPNSQQTAEADADQSDLGPGVTPEIYSVVRTDAEQFSISFMDSHEVIYRLSTGSPHGDIQAELIRTYVNLNARVLQLTTLFRKLAKLAHLDIPLSGTFSPPVLSILVIFYLQHCYPPELPNLHALYKAHRDHLPPKSFRQVFSDNDDLSFLTDFSLIKEYWKSNSMATSSFETVSISSEADTRSISGKTEPMDLADLWLGLLRFYLFDFQRTKCTVNIVETQPVMRKRDASIPSGLFVSDPFDPMVNLCKSINSCGFKFIFAQLLACYAYFGVPRLTNGRHVFTHIRVNTTPSEQSEAEARQTRAAAPGATTQSVVSTANASLLNRGDAHPRRMLHLAPVINDANEFNDNLIKVCSLLVEKFMAERGPVTEDTSRSIMDREDGIPTVSLVKLMPHLFHFVLDEVLQSEDVPEVTEKCLHRFWHLLKTKVAKDTPVAKTELMNLCNQFARRYWSNICAHFINKGQMTVSEAGFVRETSFAARCAVLRWRAQSHSAGTNESVESNKPDEMDPSKPEDLVDSNLRRCDPDGKNSDQSSGTNSDTQYMDAEDQLWTTEPDAETGDEGGSGSNEDDDEDDDDDEEEEEEEEEGDIDELIDLDNTRDSETVPTNRFLNETEDGAGEYAECTLDLGDDDDDDANDDDSEQVLEAVQQAAAVSIPAASVEQSTPAADMELETPKPCVLESQKRTTPTSQLTSTPGEEESKTQVLKRPRVTEQRDTVSSKSKKTNKKSSEVANTWATVIVPQSTVSEAIDDDRPGYYHSQKVNAVQSKDLSFPFTAWGQLSAVGHHSIRSSVLGLNSTNQPSTMLAHFSSPEPQCRACGQVGHRQATCQTATDKSVSFASWLKQRSHTKRNLPHSHIQALSDCLIELAGFHDCTGQATQRQLLVNELHKVFSTQFPTVELNVFGSCANGFELPSSDMDLCVFFPRYTRQWHELQQVDSMLNLINQFKRLLNRRGAELSITHLRAILHAKVPILKVHFANGSEVDISFSNYLALHNTRMLKLYTQIEPVVRILGIALKIIGKLCHIANASIGGVSSYALIIMLIHYLQQKDVLPVLQELYDCSEKPINLVNGWNAWFQSDMALINRLWKRPQTKPALGDLWLGFFHYYLFEFNRDLHVVTIRQKSTLTRFEKMWSSLFAVEDPFNLEHNLTGALCRDSFLCILDVFHAVLQHHTSPIPADIPTALWRYSLFCPEALATKRRLDAPAKSRCKRCHQCGHRVADCPLKNRYLPRPNNQTLDPSVQALIGPFLCKGTPLPGYGHPGSGPLVGPIHRFRAPGREFQPPMIALLPTPYHLPGGFEQTHPPVRFVVAQQHMYAGFHRPQAPYSHQNRGPPPPRPSKSRGPSMAVRPGVTFTSRSSFPRSVNPAHPPRPRVPFGLVQSTRPPSGNQRNLNREVVLPGYPNWIEDSLTYDCHFPPANHSNPHSPNAKTPQVQNQPVRPTGPINHSTPTKPLAQAAHVNCSPTNTASNGPTSKRSNQVVHHEMTRSSTTTVHLQPPHTNPVGNRENNKTSSDSQSVNNTRTKQTKNNSAIEQGPQSINTKHTTGTGKRRNRRSRFTCSAHPVDQETEGELVGRLQNMSTCARSH